MFFKPNVIKEAKRLTSTPELQLLLQSAESPPRSELDEASELYLFACFKALAIIAVKVSLFIIFMTMIYHLEKRAPVS